MIPALIEGITQSLLPCSWTLLLPAVALGLATRRATAFATFTGGVVVAAWIAATGWYVAPVWLAGIALLSGAALWWWTGPAPLPSALVGVGAGWAWRPCVGPELGDVLTTAQTDPWAALVPLGLFLIGVVGVGLLGGWGVSRFVGESRSASTTRAGSVVAGILGLTMVLGLYSDIASVLARWSLDLWG